jgi:hypothetical protein
METKARSSEGRFSMVLPPYGVTVNTVSTLGRWTVDSAMFTADDNLEQNKSKKIYLYQK